MKTEQFMVTGHGDIHLPAVIWQPDQEIKAVLQITHGMTEHMGRYEALGSMKRSGSAFEYDGWDTSLPILLISGQEDPVGDAGKGVRTIHNRMKKTGMENVTLTLLPNARHDIFHEEANGIA